MAMGVLGLAKSLYEWDIYNKWKLKIKTVETQRKKLDEDGYLTDDKATKMEEFMVEAQKDYEYLLDLQQKKEAEKKAESDKYKAAMDASVEFHNKNPFLKDIYNQWKMGYTLKGNQFPAFEKALAREIAERDSKIASIGLAEVVNKDIEAVGIPINFRSASLNTKKGVSEKISFDLKTAKGVIPNISTVEWDGRNFRLIKDVMVDGREQTVKIQYVFTGQYRNLKNVVETSLKPIVKLTAIDPTLDVSIFAPIKPRNWQSGGFNKWWNASVTLTNGRVILGGIVQAGTGAGKTVFGIMAMKKLFNVKPDGTVLVSVPTIELQRQWKAEMVKFGIPEGIITYVGGDGGQDSWGQVTIAIVNSLRNRTIKAPNGQDYDLFIGDEAHHLSDEAENNFTVWSQNNFGRMLLFSATPGRIGDQIPVVLKVTQEELQLEGSLVNYDVYNIGLEMSDKDYEEYEDLTARANASDRPEYLLGVRYRFISNHEVKVDAAVNLIKNELKDRKVIVFFTTIKTVNEFKDKLASSGIIAAAIHSKMGKKDREQSFKDFESGKIKILTGAFAIGEGLNVPDADAAIIVGGTSKEREFIQRAGRVLRVAPGKNAATIYQIYIKRTMEENWVKSRLSSVPANVNVRIL